MTIKRQKFVRNTVIEEVTAGRIREYEVMSAAVVSLPVPVEQIVERVLGLTFDWDVIDETRGPLWSPAGRPAPVEPFDVSPKP